MCIPFPYVCFFYTQHTRFSLSLSLASVTPLARVCVCVSVCERVLLLFAKKKGKKKHWPLY